VTIDYLRPASQGEACRSRQLANVDADYGDSYGFCLWLADVRAELHPHADVCRHLCQAQAARPGARQGANVPFPARNGEDAALKLETPDAYRRLEMPGACLQACALAYNLPLPDREGGGDWRDFLYWTVGFNDETDGGFGSLNYVGTADPDPTSATANERFDGG
jgi:hypothetical protein